MNRNVAHLVALVEEGFDLARVRPGHQGSLRLEMRRGPDRRSFHFAFYEVPALLQATAATGHGA
jgi:hypothetical protein